MVLLDSLHLFFSASEVVFRENSAAESGGGVFILPTVDETVVSDISFTSMSARAGGGMYVTASAIIVDRYRFEGNRAEESGGAIHSVAGVKSFVNTYFR